MHLLGRVLAPEEEDLSGEARGLRDELEKRIEETKRSVPAMYPVAMGIREAFIYDDFGTVGAPRTITNLATLSGASAPAQAALSVNGETTHK